MKAGGGPKTVQYGELVSYDAGQELVFPDFSVMFVDEGTQGADAAVWRLFRVVIGSEESLVRFPQPGGACSIPVVVGNQVFAIDPVPGPNSDLQHNLLVVSDLREISSALSRYRDLSATGDGQ